jgi:hypothetical protein
LTQLAPASLVASISSPFNPSTTAQQSLVFGQETLGAEYNEPGKDSLVHTCPPSVVTSADAPGGVVEDRSVPPAVQKSCVEHEMDERFVNADATSWLCQLAPPSVVARTSPSPAVVVPTTQQSDLFAHEMPSRLPMPSGTCCAVQV